MDGKAQSRSPFNRKKPGVRTQTSCTNTHRHTCVYTWLITWRGGVGQWGTSEVSGRSFVCSPLQIRIRDPNQGGRDITEEIMAGGSGSRNSTPPVGHPCSTPTPPQVGALTLTQLGAPPGSFLLCRLFGAISMRVCSCLCSVLLVVLAAPSPDYYPHLFDQLSSSQSPEQPSPQQSHAGGFTPPPLQRPQPSPGGASGPAPAPGLIRRPVLLRDVTRTA